MKMNRGILIGVAGFIAFLVTYAVLIAGPILTTHFIQDTATRLPLLALSGIMALLASLALISVSFSLADLSDKTQALGLPEGSVRAVIALSLIVLFAIVSVFLQTSLAARGIEKTRPMTKQEADAFTSNLRGDELVGREPISDDKIVVVYRLGTQAAEDFAKQIFTLIGTLMTSVASFYFASRGIATAQPKSEVSAPPLTGISPNLGVRGKDVEVKLDGKGLQLAQSVKLMQGSKEVAAIGVTSNDLVARCTFTLDAGLPTGAYDVVVTNSDGSNAKLTGAFTVS